VVHTYSSVLTTLNRSSISVSAKQAALTYLKRKRNVINDDLQELLRKYRGGAKTLLFKTNGKYYDKTQLNCK
jgi:hypothetical protein